MSINRELNEQELENVFGGDIKTEDLPSKFKKIEEEKQDGELSEEDLESIYGGPIKSENLPEGFYSERNDKIIKH